MNKYHNKQQYDCFFVCAAELAELTPRRLDSHASEHLRVSQRQL